MRLLPVALLAATLSVSSAAAQSSAAQSPTAPKPGPAPGPAVRARVDSLAHAYLRETRTPGLTLAVLRGRDTLALAAYGRADREAGRAAARGTVYRIGSLTKQFTAAAVLQLVEQGRVGLGDTLGAYLPQYPQWGRVTVRQLLNHTSGVPSYTTSARYRARLTDAFPPDTLLAFFAGEPMRFAPGTRWEYNNTGYVLLGRLLERVTGRPYAALVRERFFAPLGLRTAVYCPDVPTAPDHARGYERRGDSVAAAAPLGMAVAYSAGALCMSVPDFLHWQGALAGGRVVRPATYARMSAPDTLADGRATAYGWGLATGALDGRLMVDHTGSINGFTTAALALPADSVRVVVFTNAGAGPMPLAENLARVALGAAPRADPPPPPPAVAAALPDSVRDAVPGTYVLKLPSGGELRLALRVEGGRVVGQPDGQDAEPLVYVGDHTFGAAFDPTLRLRIVVEGGRGVRAVLTQRGGTVEGARAPAGAGLVDRRGTPAGVRRPEPERLRDAAVRAHHRAGTAAGRPSAGATGGDAGGRPRYTGRIRQPG